MDITDPRERYEDLVEHRREREVKPQKFESLDGNEAFSSGWAVAAVVVDELDRILLAYHRDDDAWLTPGGSVEPGESLREAVIREVREETGIDVIPNRPYAVVDNIARYGGKSRSFTFVMYSATPVSTEIGDHLGAEGEAIADADWFYTLPNEVFEREIVTEVLEIVRG